MSQNDVINIYKTNISTYKQEAEKLLTVSRYYSYTRLALCISLVVLLFNGEALAYNVAFFLLLLFFSGAFLASLILHNQYKDKIKLANQLVKINEINLHRIARNWSELEPIPDAINILSNNANADLNIIGDGSLTQLLLNQSTILGDQRIVDWLDTSVENINMIEQRQKAIKELTPLVTFRQLLSAFAILSRKQHHWFKKLSDWSLNRRDLPALLIIAAKLLTIISITIILLILINLLPLIAIIPLILIHLTLLFFVKNTIREAFNGLEQQSEGIKLLAKMVNHAATQTFQSTFLVDKVHEILNGQQQASSALHQLGSILHHTQLRFNVLAYIVLQLLFLWDIHVLQSLINWQKKYADHIDDWLNAIADLEACCTLATLHYNNPDWTTPRFHQEPEIILRHAGHPLLPSKENIRNDIVIQSPAQLLLITGSNMSGKTTYMRTLGLNSKLAMIGSNVCAMSMVLPMISIVSSMGVQDSLKDGRSYFMQELLQLKEVMQLIKNKPQQYVLVLLDEILKGTNASERSTAVLAVIENLLAHNALGAMTTHDIDIAELLAKKLSITPLYFQEQVDLTDSSSNDFIHFDYIVKPGIVRNTNALKLMKIIGLEIQGSHFEKEKP